ncbi:hypothetical protein ACFOY2_19605 [Nonomuraea purpurea]|uniref:Uncharacterized protein n=1 Tax=Nonomuraea purpurea TaxID=1849276 RepID=A0ABV8G8P9_9ACTN
MHSSPRRITAAALLAGGLTLLAAPAAHAVVDPVAIVTCLGSSVTESVALIDPMAPAVPAEVPSAACLQP